MKFGVLVPMFGALCDRVLLHDFAQSAEAMGFESLWMGDHIALPVQSRSRYEYVRSRVYRTHRGSAQRQDRWESTSTLAYLAGVTERVRLGVSVLVAPYRHPLETAKIFSSLDVLTGGRIELGVGSGWAAEEFAAMGVPFDERGARTDEILEIWHKAWTGETIEHEGRYYRISGVSVQPCPTSHSVPLAFGGHSQPTLRRIVVHRAAWHVVTESPEHCYGWHESLPKALDRLRERWRQVNGDDTTPGITGVIIDGPAADDDSLAAMSERYAALGVERLMLDYPAARAADAGALLAHLEHLGKVLPLRAA